MVRVKKQRDENHYDIVVDDAVVGCVYMTAPNALSLVEIDPEHRGNGYGPRAFRAVIDDVVATNDLHISTPVDDALEPVLDEYPHRRTMSNTILIPSKDTFS